MAVPKAAFRLGTDIIVASLTWQGFACTTQAMRRSPVATRLALKH